VKIEGAILGSRVAAKKDCLIQEEAVIGDRSLLDVGCVIRPRVKVWPDKMVERNSVLTMSLIWGNKWHGSLFRDLGVAGLSNLEITPEFATRLGSAFGSCLPVRSKVVTSRDSTRSSRMIKRAIIASLLSVGCDVLDLRSAAVPIARHFIRASGASGAVNVRKLPGNSRVTLIEMFDSRGAYVSPNTERKIETTFFREDFNRTDPDDLGVIEFASRAIEEYQADFFRLLDPKGSKKLRIVCDYGYSSLASIYPAMLARIGVESISLNGFNDAKLAPRSQADINEHLDNLSQVVGSLGYDMGAVFTNEGERLTVVDSKGNVLSGHERNRPQPFGGIASGTWRQRHPYEGGCAFTHELQPQRGGDLRGRRSGGIYFPRVPSRVRRRLQLRQADRIAPGNPSFSDGHRLHNPQLPTRL